MAVVDFIWLPNSIFAMGDPTPRQFTDVMEGTGIATSIPLTFAISEAQATDTVVTFGVTDLFYIETSARIGTRVTDIPGVNVGSIQEQYDLADTFRAVIPAGQTTVTFQLGMSADNQPEQYEYFNLFISEVTGGHTIDPSDVLENQQASYPPPPASIFTPVSPSQITTTHNFGFNTFRITDDDTPDPVDGTGTAFADSIVAKGLPVFAGAGDDFVSGSNGDDTILSHDGDDKVLGKGGNDTIFTGDGGDLVFGGDGNDVIFGGRGRDSILGEGDDDVLWGAGASDDNSGDSISGGEGNDTILGQGGDDVLDGDNGNDAIAAGSGADIIRGGAGADIIFGGSGDGAPDGGDLVYGGAGGDYIRGDLGTDLFVFGLGDQGDFIAGFNEGGVRDGFDLRPLFDQAGYTGTTPRADGILQVLQNGADTDVFVYGVFFFRVDGVVAAALDDSYFLIQ